MSYARVSLDGMWLVSPCRGCELENEAKHQIADPGCKSKIGVLIDECENCPSRNAYEEYSTGIGAVHDGQGLSGHYELQLPREA
jgi:hypothetical protein